jgi:hypothetical protein
MYFGLTREISLRRSLAMLWLFLVGHPWMFMNHICLSLDNIIFPDYKKTKLKNPVFVIGNYRSGTTFLHRILAKDPRATSFKFWEILFPSLTQKKLFIPVIATVDSILGHGLTKLVQKAEKRFLSKLNHIHKLSLFEAEEDEFLYLWVFFAQHTFLLFPYNEMLDDICRYDEQPRDVREKYLKFYEECLQRHIYLHGEDRMFLAKNPAQCNKLQSLADHFPDAKFIYTVRSPYEQLGSLLSLVTTVISAHTSTVAKKSEQSNRLYEENVYLYKHAIEVLDKLPSDRFAVVKYTDLVEKPRETVENAYRKLNIEISPEFAAALQKEEDKARKYKSGHEYKLEDYGFSKEQVAKDMQFVVDKFNLKGISESSDA